MFLINYYESNYYESNVKFQFLKNEIYFILIKTLELIFLLLWIFKFYILKGVKNFMILINEENESPHFFTVILYYFFHLFILSFDL